MTRRTAAFSYAIFGGLALAFSTVANAQPVGYPEYLPLQPGPESPVVRVRAQLNSAHVIVRSAFGRGFASDTAVYDQVGATRPAVMCNDQSDMARNVDVYLERSIDNRVEMFDEILREAVVAAWTQCPVTRRGMGGDRRFQYRVGNVRIYLPDNTLAVEAYGLHQVDFQNVNPRGPHRYIYDWASWTNYLATDPAQRQRVWSPPPSRIEQLGTAIVLLFGFFVLIWIASKWEAILRWWYELTPHPARKLVDAAIHQGKPIDMDAFERALVVHPANETERRVREWQLDEATERLRVHRDQLSREEAVRVARERALAAQRAEAERVYRMGRVQEEALKAALEHQVTAARVEALRKREEADE